MTTVMKNGAMVEIATVGDEGLVGINAYFGGQMLSGETMLQVPVPDASAEVMSAETFKRELGRSGPFQECVHRYSQGLLMLMMQSTGCMALHPVQERCCRWLLMTHDRVRTDEFHLSHEFLADDAGLDAAHGDACGGHASEGRAHQIHAWAYQNPGPEEPGKTACECYATVKGHFDRLGL